MIALGLFASVYALDLTVTPISVTSPIQATSPVAYPLPTKYICPNINSNLYRTNRGEEVRQLQQFLFGYYNTSINSTGYFGPSTKSYLQKFQGEHGINQTGNLGPITRSKIKMLCDGGNKACTREYMPVCGAPKNYCPPCVGNVCPACASPAPTTYSNKCELERAGATFIKNGKCEETVSNEAPAACKVWYDGCNTCSRSSVGGPLACTMMACIQGGDEAWFAAHRPQCREYFPTSNTAPVIKSFSGPVQLNVGEKGTWKLDASVYNNSPLTYSITWGDEAYASDKTTTAPIFMNSVVTQQTSFEHSYNAVGNYMVIMTVRSQNGEETKTTATVNVASSTIKCWDAGISYNEGASLSCLTNSDGSKACIADASHVCRSGVWKIEGGLWYYPLPKAN